MNIKEKKTLGSLFGIIFGLAIGQLVPFFIMPTPTWMIIDKILFGLGIGVGISGLLVVIINHIIKKRYNSK